MVDPTTMTKLLPAPKELEHRCVALAMLDAILSPDWEGRYFSFNQHWDDEKALRMASMRDGSGNDYFILFLPDGTAAIKGFDHECAAPREKNFGVHGVFDGIPTSFDQFLNEPAFETDVASFGFWYVDGLWTRSRSIEPSVMAVDGSAGLLRLLIGNARDYHEFAEDYYETEISLDAVERFFRLEPLSVDLAQALQKDADLTALEEDIEEIGYPVSR